MVDGTSGASDTIGHRRAVPGPLDAVARLARLRAALVDDAPLNDDDRHLIAGGLGCYLTRRCASLDEALGVDSLPGQADARRMVALAERDEIVRQTLADFGLTAVELAAAMARYAAAGWRHDRAMTECPPRHVGRVQERLWRILRLRDHPLSARQIRAIAAA